MCPSECLREEKWRVRLHDDLMKREVMKKRRKSTGSEQLGKACQTRRLQESHLLLSEAGQGVKAGVQELKGGRPRTGC